MMVKKILVTIGIISILLILGFFVTIGCTIWYEFFDTGDLVFYDGENIEKIIPSENGFFYMITESGKLYGFGGHDDTVNREYRNTEFTEDEKLGIPRPVLISDEMVREVIVLSGFYSLFITEENELYEFNDFEISRVASDVITAYRSFKIDGIFVIDKEQNLSLVRDDNKIQLYQGVRSIKGFGEHLFAILDNGDLCELSYIQANDTIVVAETLISDVKEFAVIDTPHKYENGKIAFESEEGKRTYILNALLSNGSLYVKGTYNALRLIHSFETPPIKTFENWTLIFENVSSFSTSEIGTTVSFKDGGVAYYGFETIHYGDVAFEYKELISNERTLVFSCGRVIVVCTDTRVMFWGGRFTIPFDYSSEEHYVFTGTPYILPKE